MKHPLLSGLVSTLVVVSCAAAQGHDHASHGAPAPVPGVESSPESNQWFKQTKLDLGSFFEDETATGKFEFENPRSESHQLSHIMPSCACSKALVHVGGRTYEVGSNKVLYRIDKNQDGTENRVRVDFVEVGPHESGDLEVHMTMAGVKGRKEAYLGLQTTDKEVPQVQLQWGAIGATFFSIEPPEVSLNEMTWTDKREFQFTVTSPMKKDFNITGLEPAVEGMTVEYTKEMRADGTAAWHVKGTYGPGARERDNGGEIRLKTDVDGRTASARVIAYVKGPLQMEPGGFVALGAIKTDEGKETEITLTPTGTFDLQVESLELDRLKVSKGDPAKAVSVSHRKEGPAVKVTIRIEKGVEPGAYISGLLKIHLNHPAAKLKEVMFNGFVR